jgi:hypothetical protein
MNCEEGRNKTASPQTPGHSLEREKQEDDGYRVQKNIGEMMPASVQPVQLAIQHVRNGRDGVPVTAYCVCEAPSDPSQRQPCGDVSIRIDVLWVVEADELMSQGLAENQPRDRGKNSTYPNNYFVFRSYYSSGKAFCHAEKTRLTMCSALAHVYQITATGIFGVLLHGNAVPMFEMQPFGNSN